MHQVAIDDVIEALHEDHEQTCTDGDSGKDLGSPVDAWVRCPCEPEHADREEAAADDHGNEPLFRNHSTFRDHFGFEPGESQVANDCASNSSADDDGDEWEGANTQIPATHLFEGDGESREEKVNDAINN